MQRRLRELHCWMAAAPWPLLQPTPQHQQRHCSCLPPHLPAASCLVAPPVLFARVPWPNTPSTFVGPMSYSAFATHHAAQGCLLVMHLPTVIHSEQPPDTVQVAVSTPWQSLPTCHPQRTTMPSHHPPAPVGICRVGPQHAWRHRQQRPRLSAARPVP